MIVSGKEMADAIFTKLKERVTLLAVPPKLVIITCAPNFETQKFLKLKQRRASELGISTNLIEVIPATTLADVRAVVEKAKLEADGIIIQFPFPHLATIDLIALIPPSHDLDVFNYNGQGSLLLPPVIGAIDYMSSLHNVVWADKQVVIIGQGLLVGKPAVTYAKTRGSKISIITKENPDLSILKTADIIISGAGSPGLVTADLVKEEAVIFDAGTSEEKGILKGDIDPEVVHKASLFTPVPGGIGPVTIAILFQNLLNLIEHRK